jgi:aspartokinase
MRGIPGVAGRTFSALGRDEVNIIAIAQGSSEYNISLVIEASAMQRSLTTLHKEFRLDESTPSSEDTSPVTNNA